MAERKWSRAAVLESLAERRYVADANGPVSLLSSHPPLSGRVARLHAGRESAAPVQ